MASGKSKKQRRREKRRVFEDFERNLTAKAALHRRPAVIRRSGQFKMSEVLLDFIEPYRENARSEDELRTLITIGLVAWNAALLPKESREQTIDRMINRDVHDGAGEFRQFVYEMIERKQRWFAPIKRLILGYDLTFTENGPHLSVISTVT